MRKSVFVSALSLILATGVSYASDGCANLGGTTWSGDFSTVVKIMGNTAAECGFQDSFVINSSMTQVNVTGKLVSSSGPQKSHCPNSVKFTSNFSCSDNTVKLNMKWNNQDPVKAYLNGGNIHGTGSFKDPQSHGIPVDYTLQVIEDIQPPAR